MTLVNNRQIDQRYKIGSKKTDLYEQLADLWQKDDSIRLKQKNIVLEQLDILIQKEKLSKCSSFSFYKA